MKKNILKFGIALAVVAAAGYTAYSSQTEIQLSGVSITRKCGSIGQWRRCV